jgi:hypothetical protein
MATQITLGLAQEGADFVTHSVTMTTQNGEPCDGTKHGARLKIQSTNTKSCMRDSRK